MLGLGLSIPQVAARGSRSLVAAIRSLFANNEPGVWYDPSDLSTLFQDATGTTPVTAVEQPVGLMLDKSKGLVLGSEIYTSGANGFTSLTGISGVNATVALSGSGVLITTSVDRAAARGEFTISGLTSGKHYLVQIKWVSVLVQGTASQGAASWTAFTTPTSTHLTPGTLTCRVTAQGTSGLVRMYSGFTSESLAGDAIRVDSISVRELPGNHAYQTTATSRPVLSARVNQYLATETLATQNVTTLAAQYRLSFEGTGTVTLSGTATGVYSAGSHLITCTAGTLTSTVSGSVTKADLRVANDGANLPPYQRVNTATDYDTVGFPHYLRFDGTDDGMVTNSIDFSSTDKLTVCAGVRKLSDAVSSFVAEHGIGGMDARAATMITAPRSPTTLEYRSQIRDGTYATESTSISRPAPDTAVHTHELDYAKPWFGKVKYRINGTAVISKEQGTGAATGNFGNYPLHLFRRGSSNPFNGRFYGMLIVGRLLSDSELRSTEKYINTKTRAY